MSQIVEKRKTVHVEEYGLDFVWRNDPDSGFSFKCDKSGKILYNEMGPAALENLKRCRDHTYDVVEVGVVDYSYDYVEDAILKCSCGQRVPLSNIMTNECEECGQLYNGYGQMLAPRRNW